MNAWTIPSAKRMTLPIGMISALGIADMPLTGKVAFMADEGPRHRAATEPSALRRTAQQERALKRMLNVMLLLASDKQSHIGATGCCHRRRCDAEGDWPRWPPGEPG